MNELILGAHGLIGMALAKQLPNACQGVRPDVDLTRYDTLFQLFSTYRPRVVYLSAANANVDACESPITNEANVQGALTVLRLCEQFEAMLVYFSSSYVFDGRSKWPYTPDADTCPINNYGRQKETVEHHVLQSYAKCVIVRTVGVFGRERHARNFAKMITTNIFTNKKVQVPTDQYMNPVLSDDLARVTIRLADGRHTGVWHVAGDTCMTKYDFAHKIASYFDLEKLVVPVKSKELLQKAPRPKMGCLDCYGLEETGLTVPSFESGLTHFLEMEMV